LNLEIEKKMEKKKKEKEKKNDRNKEFRLGPTNPFRPTYNSGHARSPSLLRH
jgi:hypothetical protein